VHKVIRGVIAGSMVGAAVGAAMLWQNSRNRHHWMRMGYRRSRRLGRQAENAWRMMRDQAMHWTSGVRRNTGLLSRNFIRRMH